VTPQLKVLELDANKYRYERFHVSKLGTNLINSQTGAAVSLEPILAEVPLLYDYVRHMVTNRAFNAAKLLLENDNNHIYEYIRGGLKSWSNSLNIIEKINYDDIDNKDIKDVTISANIHTSVSTMEKYGVPTTIKILRPQEASDTVEVLDVTSGEKSSKHSIVTEAETYQVIEIRPKSFVCFETKAKTFHDQFNDQECLSKLLLNSNTKQMKQIITKFIKQFVVALKVETIGELAASLHGKLMNQPDGFQNFMLDIEYPQGLLEYIKSPFMRKFTDGGQTILKPELANKGDKVILFQLRQSDTAQ